MKGKSEEGWRDIRERKHCDRGVESEGKVINGRTKVDEGGWR